jgi:hypothetical protein
MKGVLSRTKGWLKAPLFSAKGLATRAVIIASAFAIIHLLGWREHASFLSGTTGAAGTSLKVSAVLGMIYIASYFGFVLVTPILLIAAGIQGVFERFSGIRSAGSRASSACKEETLQRDVDVTH